MLKKILSTAVLSLFAVTTSAAPGQPPAVKSWTILSIASYGNQSVVTTYGTYSNQAACVSALKSIIAKNPYITEYNGTPSSEYDMGVTATCVPGTGGSVMQTTQ